MEPKTIWFCLFAASIIGMHFASNRAGKHVVDDFEVIVKTIPSWQRLIYGLLDVCPFYLLKKAGKKWQIAVCFLLIPALISGYHLGQMIAK